MIPYPPYLRFPLRVICLCAALLTLASGSFCAESGRNLLLNGDFSKGSGDQPDNWRTEAWINRPDAFRTLWVHSQLPYELEVNNQQANDGRWMQSLALRPGWYQLSAEIRTEDVGAGQTGANISVMEDGIMSRDLHGTLGWQRVWLYLKVGGQGADVELALRVGGFASLNSGRAFFRDARLVEVVAPPAGAAQVYDLAAIRQQAAPEPLGSPISLVLTFMVLGAAAYFGLRLFGDEASLPPSRSDSKTAPGPRKRSRR